MISIGVDAALRPEPAQVVTLLYHVVAVCDVVNVTPVPVAGVHGAIPSGLVSHCQVIPPPELVPPVTFNVKLTPEHTLADADAVTPPSGVPSQRVVKLNGPTQSE